MNQNEQPEPINGTDLFADEALSATERDQANQLFAERMKELHERDLNDAKRIVGKPEPFGDRQCPGCDSSVDGLSDEQWGDDYHASKGGNQ